MRLLLTLAAAGALASSVALAQTSTTGPATQPGVTAPGSTAPAGAPPSDRRATPANPETTNTLQPGANSFTEAQARGRIEDQGFQNVTDLRKDDQGIWRAKAQKDGRSVTVSLDYRGNVVQQ